MSPVLSTTDLSTLLFHCYSLVKIRFNKTRVIVVLKVIYANIKKKINKNVQHIFNFRNFITFMYLYFALICLGGLVVSVFATGPKVAGSIPAEVDGFLRVIEIRSTTSFGGKVKPSVPCRRFTACKRTLRA
jgi:hypothetical protein